MYDVHTHFIPSPVLDWLKRETSVQSRLQHTPEKENPILIVNEKWGFELKPAFYDPDVYLEDQHAAGVEHSLVSPAPQLFLYESPPDVAEEAARVYNWALADWVKTHPNRLSALGTVPLQDPTRAALLLRDALSWGLKGVIVGTGFNGRLLTDQEYQPFWEEADARGAILFLHPLLSDDPRLKKRKMANLIGVPWETTVCAVDLILSGHLDRYPNVKILLAHGGGFLPYQIGRITKGYEEWPDVAASLEESPVAYLRRLWFDNVLWNRDCMALLVKTVGEARVLPGSDYPFDLSAWPPAPGSSSGVKSLLSLDH
ncbi:MAG: amidohydrolase [Alicyclobacillaceae bacterium]|nr:amidohydrolase [Alicyclobacillaceae bacterium]